MARSAKRWSETLHQQIQLNTRNVLSSPELHALVAQQCRDLRDGVIREGRASPAYTTTVDGVANADEELVRLDGGIVSYVFSSIAQAANWALSECQKRSPVRSGDFRRSWVILVDGQLWTQPPATIPGGSEVWIVNTSPYWRKIDTGGQKTRVDPQIIEAVRQAAQRRFQGVRFGRLFKSLAGGRDVRGGPVPYVLKSAGTASGLSWSRKTGWSRKHAAHTSRRPDRQAGQQMLYPTLVLTEHIG